jgi:hypothetical protein
VRLLCFTLIVALAGGVSVVRAQTNGNASSSGPSMSGVVKAVSAVSLTIERDGAEVLFSVNSSTRLLRRGPAPWPRDQFYPNGARDLVLRNPPPTIADLLKPGERVRVRFRQSGSALRAVDVRVIPTR